MFPGEEGHSLSSDAGYDVCIIGAGPVGCLAAKELASRGHNVAIFEQFSTSGFPNHCSGLISEEGFRKLAVPLPNTLIENRVANARVYAPNGSFLRIQRRKKEMLVVDRSKLDAFLAERAVDEGTIVHYSHKVTNLLSHKSQITGCSGKANTGQWKANAPVTICAEGVRARLLHRHGYPTPNSAWNLPAVQYELENVQIDRNTVDLFHGSQWAPGFFAWIIPTRERCARVGLATLSKWRFSTKKLLNKFLVHHPIASDHLRGYKIILTRGGSVPAAGPNPHTVFDGLVVVGDAAGQAKPTTGGGVNIGGHCARIAGRIISECLEKEQYSKKAFRKYEQIWRRHYYRELLLMSFFRRATRNIPNRRIDDGIRALKEMGIESMLGEVTNIDLHATDLALWLLQPSFIKQAIRGFPFLALGIISTLTNS
ncbi:MAG: NAD(P)/FAD-dependent oxidoreductase [Candidatus Hodarchaeales archaeon]